MIKIEYILRKLFELLWHGKQIGGGDFILAMAHSKNFLKNLYLRKIFQN